MDLEKELQQLDDGTLWALIADMGAVLENRGYKPDKQNRAFMFWYGIYAAARKEIDSRLMEGEKCE